jgi:hypothetical protein
MISEIEEAVTELESIEDEISLIEFLRDSKCFSDNPTISDIQEKDFIGLFHEIKEYAKSLD